ncbi:hypothetical protein ABT124_34640 [Streptomyces sp. NPDC001982]
MVWDSGGGSGPATVVRAVVRSCSPVP